MKITHSIFASLALLLLFVAAARAEEAAQANPVQIVTSANNYAEMDQMSQALIQLCRAEECKFDKILLDKAAKGLTTVAFVQMNTVDNAEFAARIHKEQQETLEFTHNVFVRIWRVFARWAGWGGEYEQVRYPIYVFKGSALTVAYNINGVDDIKSFVQVNSGSGSDESGLEPETQTEQP